MEAYSVPKGGFMHSAQRNVSKPEVASGEEGGQGGIERGVFMRHA